MNKEQVSQEQPQITVPDDSVYHEYVKYICITPSGITFIPFVSTSALLTTPGARAMLEMPGNALDFYEQ